MRIFAKRAFQFDHPAGHEPAVVVQSQSFADVPDWVAASTMFKLASISDDVTVIEMKQDEKAAESGKGKTSTRGRKGSPSEKVKEPGEGGLPAEGEGFDVPTEGEGTDVLDDEL
ncbi:hypothetical protein H7K32_21170 [Brevibacillus agri]|uniref:hypothetical protein n=1 Tax=Brevibacillus agri TaxID=51101 RepID=UPI001C8D7C14|nr:hypothetical protein [Brevibacillus agri]MBY0054127.1 hypothetical protein [Brevibacillus agri]